MTFAKDFLEVGKLYEVRKQSNLEWSIELIESPTYHNAKVYSSLKAGDVFTVLERVNNRNHWWFKLMSTSGKFGYMSGTIELAVSTLYFVECCTSSSHHHVENNCCG